MYKKNFQNLIRKASAASLAAMLCLVLWNQIFTPLHLISHDHSGASETIPQTTPHEHSHTHSHDHHHGHVHDQEQPQPSEHQNEEKGHHKPHAALDHQLVFTSFAFESEPSQVFVPLYSEQTDDCTIDEAPQSSEQLVIFLRGPPKHIS